MCIERLRKRESRACIREDPGRSTLDGNNALNGGGGAVYNDAGGSNSGSFAITTSELDGNFAGSDRDYVLKVLNDDHPKTVALLEPVKDSFAIGSRAYRRALYSQMLIDIGTAHPKI